MQKNRIEKYNELGIKNKIYSIRECQVMLDSDLAELYEVETRIINQAVKRNIERFPEEFCFRLSKNEMNNWKSQNMTPNSLRSQNVIIENQKGRHSKYLPYVFTEQGVAMLAGILKSNIAIKISIQIIKEFVEMRKFINTNAQLFQQFDRVESKQIENTKNIEKIFSLIESNDIIPKQGIFFEGQIFDAYKFVSNLFRSAKKSIVIIDNYVDDSVLIHLTKKKKDVKVKILTKSISEQFNLDVAKFEKQYFKIEVEVFKQSHDRFIIIDDKIVYHFGASLKDLGKKWFGFSKFGKDAIRILERVGM